MLSVLYFSVLTACDKCYRRDTDGVGNDETVQNFHITVCKTKYVSVTSSVHSRVTREGFSGWLLVLHRSCQDGH